MDNYLFIICISSEYNYKYGTTQLFDYSQASDIQRCGGSMCMCMKGSKQIVHAHRGVGGKGFSYIIWHNLSLPQLIIKWILPKQC